MVNTDLAALLARQYRIFTSINPTGGWHIWFPDLPGCMSSAETWDEVGTTAREAFEGWIVSEWGRGHPIPEVNFDLDDEGHWPNGLRLPHGPYLPQPREAVEAAWAELEEHRRESAFEPTAT